MNIQGMDNGWVFWYYPDMNGKSHIHFFNDAKDIDLLYLSPNESGCNINTLEMSGKAHLFKTQIIKVFTI